MTLHIPVSLFAGCLLPKLKWTFLVSLLMFGLAQFRVLAQPAATPAAAPPEIAERELIQQLLKRVEDLETQLKELKGPVPKPIVTRAPSESPAPTSSSSSSGSVATAWTSAPAPDAANQSSDVQPASFPALQIRGFGDVGFQATRQRRNPQTNSFGVGQFDLFLTSQLSEKLTVLSELVLEANHENELHFEMERLLLQYSANDYFNLSVGRYHTAIGYYNTAYHHGKWLETAIDRPFMFGFEDQGGILPVHNIGASIRGRVPSGKLGLRYIAEIGNGAASRTSLAEPVQTAVDENRGKALNFGLQARPELLPGFQIGASIYRDKLAPAGQPTIQENILTVHALYQTPRFEFLNEALVVQHNVQGGRRFQTPGFYSQLSYQMGKWRPYVRYEYLKAPWDEPRFSDVGLRYGPTLGLRYNFSELAAFKFQYNRTALRNQPALNRLGLQFAFTF